MKKISVSVIAAASAVAVLGCLPALAQSNGAQKPVHHSLFSFLHKPKPAAPAPHHSLFSHKSTMSSHPMSWHPATNHAIVGGHSSPSHHPTAFAGGFIGNKKTHVFHVPGGHSPLPAPANRIYFRSAAQAIAAGYHQAKN
jgi:hypothetical protein